jgi:hypothetical protein
MKTVNVVYKVCLALLIGTGLQFFMYGIITFNMIDFSSYGIINWVFQIIYFTYCITLSLKLD